MDNTTIGFEEADEISDYIFLDSKRYESNMKGE
jgi:hypothetical protein